MEDGKTYTCEKCGAENLGINDYPFCPHGRYKNATGDYKGHTDDLSFTKTESFSTRGDFEKYLKRNKLEVRGHPNKRTDKGRWV